MSSSATARGGRNLVRDASFAVLSLIACAAAAFAEPALKLKRGLPTDIWLSWPEDDRLRNDTFLSVFPEWRRKYGSAQYRAAKKSGFDFVRLTIDPAAFLTAPDPARTDRLIAGALETVRDIRAADLNVIVDMHAIPKATRSEGSESYVASEAAFATYMDLVGKFAIALQHQDPAHVGFEPFNEPVLDCDLAAGEKPRWPNMLLRLHKAFRAHNPSLTMVLSGACWGGAQGLAALNPALFKDDNIIWSFHSYEPFLVTHQGASWSEGPTQYVDGLSYPIKPKEKKSVLARALKRIAASRLSGKAKSALVRDTRHDIETYFKGGEADRLMREPFDIAQAWAKAHGVAPEQMLLGEFGAIRQDKFGVTHLATRAAVMRGIRKLAQEQGIAWSTWSWGGSFGLAEDEELKQFSPELLRALGLEAE